uniref:hypothetical protein n=1 Tax=Prevotella sp. TaxID=59823 RepID=UPI00402A52AB
MKTTTSQHGKRCLWRRSWSVGIATALLAAVPFVASAQGDGATGDENTIATYKGVEDLPGETFEELKAGITSDCSYGDPTKVYFLYNVGTGKFLNMGGYWGTHASMKDYPMPLWTRKGSYAEATDGSITPSLNFTHNIATTEGNLIKWVNSGSSTDAGVFCDRPEDSNTNGYDGWFFEEVEGDEKNTYRIYTYSTRTVGLTSSRLYLFGYPQGLGTADKNCGADTKQNLSQDFPNDDFHKWRVLTLQDVYTLQQENSEDLDGPLDLSFKLKCPGFERGRTDINEWYVYTSSVAPESYTRIGLEEYNFKTRTTKSTSATPLSRGMGEDHNNGKFTTSSPYTYNFPYSNTDSKPITNKNDYRRFMGKFFCMDVHGTHGYIYQKVFVKHPGTYVVECKGYSNTPKAHLFAGVAGQDDQGMGSFDGSRRTIMLNQVSYMTEAEKSRLHVTEQNMDYAGKEFYESNKYNNSVIVQVTQKMIDNAGDAGACIAFGLYIGNPNDANETPDADEWTVFDDFRVLYASNVKSEDLILDELRGDLKYLEDGITYKNRMLRLAKTFTKDRWNSFVLPVDLTVSQVRAAFGANVRLAKLKALTDTELQFETVNLDENDKVTALEAYWPYIIFPTKTMEANNGSPYTATITTTGTGDNYEVTIQGQRFEIPNVTFKMTNENKNDLTNMEANWTTKLTHKAGAITAYGTFVRTFDPDAKQDDSGKWSFSSRRGEIIPGYDKLVGSYFFDNGNVYYSDTKERGLRGFSCWFKPNNNEVPAFYLDGVKQDAELTSIGELIVGPEAANRYGKNNGVYNLQGQRVGNTTEGLPSGIYIVNGRKHVVR